MNINYDLIGSHPEMNSFPLERAMELCATSIEVVAAIEHFYGLALNEAGSFSALMDAVKAAEQHAEVR